MYPPIFAAVNVPPVQALLKTGAGPLRFYLFGMAPQNVVKPYAVWRQVYGAPENYIGDRPDMDGFTTQVDVYVGPNDPSPAAKARAIAEAIRDAVEGVAYVTAWIGDSRDPQTMNYVFTFQAEWLTPR
jgi:Protein of unknown function (DUF3168)